MVDTESSPPPNSRFLILELSFLRTTEPLVLSLAEAPVVVDKFENLLILGNIILN